VNHFAVARTRAHADCLGGFEHDHFAPARRERTRHREPDHAGADYDTFDLVHVPRRSRLRYAPPRSSM